MPVVPYVADGGAPVAERDAPQPEVLGHHFEADLHRVGVAGAMLIRLAHVGEERHAAIAGRGVVQAQQPHQCAAVATAVDEGAPCEAVLLAAVPRHQFHTGRVLKINTQGLMAEVDIRSEAPGLLGKHIVEVVTRHLPRPCPTLSIVFPEGQVEHLAVTEEARAPLDSVVLRLERGQHTGLIPMPHAQGQQALPDDETREHRTLHHGDSVALLGQPGCGCGTGRAGTDDEHVRMMHVIGRSARARPAHRWSLSV